MFGYCFVMKRGTERKAANVSTRETFGKLDGFLFLYVFIVLYKVCVNLVFFFGLLRLFNVFFMNGIKYLDILRETSMKDVSMALTSKRFKSTFAELLRFLDMMFRGFVVILFLVIVKVMVFYSKNMVSGIDELIKIVC